MATAILSSRDSLTHRFDHETLIHRNPNSRHKMAPCRRKRTVVVSPAMKTNLVMGQVKILKRGESLSEFRNKNVDRDNDTRRPVQNQIGALILVRDYAGAGCSVSPPPSSVPFPCFLDKN
ncbi:unnamed protein product [Arabis nemorensis]|uniref:Uncharacterized protein n=1 Tax=Arabis nemorensis TaxID=586526 RepID=A0A565C027_9BRAS|nr:unnamed protein product [Arabis nemorensis]